MSRKIVNESACFEIASKKERNNFDIEIRLILEAERKDNKVIDTMVIKLKNTHYGVRFENINDKSMTCPTNKQAGITIDYLIKKHNLKQRKKYLAGINSLGQIITIIGECK